MPAVCLISDHFVGDFDAERRRDAIANMKTLLSAIAELGGYGAVTPASYGMHSNSLPPFRAPRSPRRTAPFCWRAWASLPFTPGTRACVSC